MEAGLWPSGCRGEALGARESESTRPRSPVRLSRNRVRSCSPSTCSVSATQRATASRRLPASRMRALEHLRASRRAISASNIAPAEQQRAACLCLTAPAASRQGGAPFAHWFFVRSLVLLLTRSLSVPISCYVRSRPRTRNWATSRNPTTCTTVRQGTRRRITRVSVQACFGPRIAVMSRAQTLGAARPCHSR